MSNSMQLQQSLVLTGRSNAARTQSSSSSRSSSTRVTLESALRRATQRSEDAPPAALWRADMVKSGKQQT